MRHLLKKLFSAPMNYLDTTSKSIDNKMGVYFWTLNFFHWCTWVLWLCNVFQSQKTWDLQLCPSFFTIILVILSHVHFQINLKINWPVSDNISVNCYRKKFWKSNRNFLKCRSIWEYLILIMLSSDPWTRNFFSHFWNKHFIVFRLQVMNFFY